MALCESPRLELTEAFTLIGVLLIAIMLYIICTFIVYIRSAPKSRHYGKKKKDAKQIHLTYLIKTGFIFFTIILLAMVIEIISVFKICSNNKYNNLFYKFIPFIFKLQINISLFLWYLQMYLLLLNTKYNISKCTNIISIITFITFICFTIIKTFISNFYIFHFGTIFIYTFQFIFISYLFIYKLCKSCTYSKLLSTKISISNEDEIYKTQKYTNDRIIHKLTKLQILYFISTIISISSLIIISFLYIEFIVYFIILLDIFKNFICIILSYRYYHKYYRKICKCFHKPCILMIQKCICCCVNNSRQKTHENVNSFEPITTPNVKSFDLKDVINSETTSSKPVFVAKEIENMEIIRPETITPNTENNNKNEHIITVDSDKENSVIIKHINHTQTATQQMEEILDDILGDYLNENMAVNKSNNTTANNTDNEESELP